MLGCSELSCVLLRFLNTLIKDLF